MKGATLPAPLALTEVAYGVPAVALGNDAGETVIVGAITVNGDGGLELGKFPKSPPYWAVTVRSPTASVAGQLAARVSPEPDNGTALQPGMAPRSDTKATVPEGCEPVTSAVKVTVVLARTGDSGVADSAVEVSTGLTAVIEPGVEGHAIEFARESPHRAALNASVKVVGEGVSGGTKKSIEQYATFPVSGAPPLDVVKTLTLPPGRT